MKKRWDLIHDFIILLPLAVRQSAGKKMEASEFTPL